MQNSPKRLNRHTIRLKDFDYSQEGAYFVTLCVQHKKCLFGRIDNTTMKLNIVGKMIEAMWLALPERFPHIELDQFIVMPNHLHGIIDIVGAPLVDARDDQAAPTHGRAGIKPAPTIGNIVGAFKSLTTNEYIRRVKLGKFSSFDKTIWQRNFYEHVVRDDKDLDRLRQYINYNPMMWHEDELFYAEKEFNPIS